MSIEQPIHEAEGFENISPNCIKSDLYLNLYFLSALEQPHVLGLKILLTAIKAPYLVSY